MKKKKQVGTRGEGILNLFRKGGAPYLPPFYRTGYRQVLLNRKDTRYKAIIMVTSLDNDLLLLQMLCWYIDIGSNVLKCLTFKFSQYRWEIIADTNVPYSSVMITVGSFFSRGPVTFISYIYINLQNAKLILFETKELVIVDYANSMPCTVYHRNWNISIFQGLQ